MQPIDEIHEGDVLPPLIIIHGQGVALKGEGGLRVPSISEKSKKILRIRTFNCLSGQMGEILAFLIETLVSPNSNQPYLYGGDGSEGEHRKAAVLPPAAAPGPPPPILL